MTLDTSSSIFSPILHLLATLLLQLRLPLAGSSTRLRHTCGILVSTPHACVCRIRCIRRVCGDDDPQPPGIVADKRGKKDASIGPVANIPHVLSQAFSVEVLTWALDNAIFVVGGAGETLKVELDEELGRGEYEVQDDGFATEGRAEDEGAEEPPEEVDGEGDIEGLVEAFDVGGCEGFGSFLWGVSVCLCVVCSAIGNVIEAERGQDVSRCFYNAPRKERPGVMRW